MPSGETRAAGWPTTYSLGTPPRQPPTLQEIVWYGASVPRAGQVKPPTDERLSDRVAIGLLTRTFTAEAVDTAIASTDRGEVRNRLLPARVTVYYVLAMCLFSGQGYEEVMRLLVGGLEWLSRWRRVWTVPSTAAIAKARARLGAEPLRVLFQATVGPLATEATREIGRAHV